MYISKRLVDCGLTATIIVRKNTEERLKTKCFRGTHLPLAGNFLLWDSAEDLFQNRMVLAHFLRELDELWLDDEKDFGTHSVTIRADHMMGIGWESTGSLDDYPPDALERFDLNRRSWGLRVMPGRTDLLAPQTRDLTIVFEFKSEDGKPVAVVHSIYPGIDVGELDGDVTEREKRIFFDWNHPGAA